MRRYLVTGGCGFIGSHLVDRLVARGAAVRVLDDLSTGTTAFLPERVELLEGSCADRQLVREATRDIDGCFHLAAVASVPRCNQAWLDSHHVNLSATVTLFELASAGDGQFPVVYASSAAVYGDRQEVPLAEHLPIRPCSPYGADKAACELHARAGASVRGLAAVGLRFFNVYGPRQNPDSPYSGVISAFAGRMATAGRRGTSCSWATWCGPWSAPCAASRPRAGGRRPRSTMSARGRRPASGPSPSGSWP
jgi:UDP-glucose 4-epimerase